jgi:hypothetical protein
VIKAFDDPDEAVFECACDSVRVLVRQPVAHAELRAAIPRLLKKMRDPNPKEASWSMIAVTEIIRNNDDDISKCLPAYIALLDGLHGPRMSCIAAGILADLGREPASALPTLIDIWKKYQADSEIRHHLLGALLQVGLGKPTVQKVWSEVLITSAAVGEPGRAVSYFSGTAQKGLFSQVSG